MEYTVQKLGSLAGVSARTLRYYDEVGILKPARINSSGYRIYGQQEVNRLQQILFFRELGVSIDEIKAVMNRKDYNPSEVLQSHHSKLLERKEQIDRLILNVEKTIAEMEGRIVMSNNEKFEGLKQELVNHNEIEFGKEIRETYGDEVIDKSNKKMLQMTEEEYDSYQTLEQEILTTLDKAFLTGDPAGELGQKAAQLHHKWLLYSWDKYSKEAHKGLAMMYSYDDRFRKYYEKSHEGAAEFLKDAIIAYTDNL